MKPIFVPLSQRRSHPPTTNETTDSIYITVDDGPPSSSLDEQSLTWNDVFYSNEQDDHARVLNDIAEIGAFLIRPSSQANNSSDHQHTLSVYTFDGIVKYKLLSLSNGNFSLTTNHSEPEFDDIPKLCEHYRNHSLPHSSSRNDSSKGLVGDLCLKAPYSFYLSDSNSY